jgi:hypothetical protein
MKSSVKRVSQEHRRLTMTFGRAQANFLRFRLNQISVSAQRAVDCRNVLGPLAMARSSSCNAWLTGSEGSITCTGGHDALVSLRAIAFARGQHPQMVAQPGADFGEYLSSVVERPRCGLRCDRNGSLTGRRGQHSHLPHEISAGR